MNGDKFLADVAGALPIALEKQGHQVRITLPKYKMVKEKDDTAAFMSLSLANLCLLDFKSKSQ